MPDPTPDPLDLLTLAEGRQAISKEPQAVSNAEVIALHITAVSRIIDDRCGPVVQRDVTAEEHDGRGQRRILLELHPVVEITEVRQAVGGSVSILGPVGFGETGDGYRAERWARDPSGVLLSGVLLRRRGGFGYAPWCGEVEVTYVAGRVADTGSVPQRFKDCAGAVLRRLWKREAGAWAQSADFWQKQDDDAVQHGFYKVAAPVIDEMLWDEVQTHLAAVAR